MVFSSASVSQVKLEEALTQATDFHNSLQDFINWLTQAEQTLNMVSPASLILETIMFQIDEHKVTTRHLTDDFPCGLLCRLPPGMLGKFLHPAENVSLVHLFCALIVLTPDSARPHPGVCDGGELPQGPHHRAGQDGNAP